MNSPASDPAARERLRAEIEALDGVHRAVLDGPPWSLFLVCQRQESAVPAEPAARAILAREGISGPELSVHLCYLPGAQPQRRVRFVRAALEHPPGRAVATVALEWEGKLFEDRQEGESGAPLELRLVALTAIRVVEAVIGGAMRFHLVGIKALRAFDADVVVALLRTEQGGRAPLIGATIAGESPARAATLAVLNATNRVLGNYLATED